MTSAIEFVTINWDGHPVSIEHQWIGAADDDAPLMVFLHEGLGSLAMWKEFPLQLCASTGFRGLVYSRPGYGRSTPRADGEHWGTDFMHRQAHALLPALLRALRIDVSANPFWLCGHSDGGSIALLFAAGFPERVAGVIVLSPHIMVEEITVTSIEQARATYLETDLRQRLARYHTNPDSAFWGWNDVWLQPEFRDWSIEEELTGIRCPVLALQGLDDEYGTLEQIRGIARRVVQSEIVELPDCGHSPHRDRPRELIRIASRFVQDTIRATTANEAGFSANY